jgi:exosortase/archaeosortase family protein
MKRKNNSLSGGVTERAKKLSAWRFILTYLLLMGAFLFFMGFEPIKKLVDINGIYTNFIVVISSKLLAAIGMPCTYHGSIIQLPTISLDVLFGCNGLEAVLIYSIAVVSFPARWDHKVIGIVVGFFIIQFINIIRIVALAYSGVYYMSIFEVVHLYVAQGIMIAVSLGTFLLFLSYLNYEERKEQSLT